MKTNTTGSVSLAVIIPYRNEANRINPLIESINKQKYLSPEIKFVFCNDHSTDKSSEIIKQAACFQFQILELENNSGKKAAIHHGVLMTDAAYILTLDADVVLPEKYFENLTANLQGDLLVLPVKLSAENFIQKLSSIEFEWLQKLTFGSPKPSLCNGANLIFKRSAYLEIYKHRNDLNHPSGDDVFLLQHMLKENKIILRKNSNELEVVTPAPNTIHEHFLQRKRWVGKLSHMKKSVFILPGLFLVLIQFSFFVCLIAGFFQPLFFLPLILKFVSEALLISDGENKKLIPFLVIHQFWYPVYLVRLIFQVKPNDRWNRTSKPS